MHTKSRRSKKKMHSLKILYKAKRAFIVLIDLKRENKKAIYIFYL